MDDAASSGQDVVRCLGDEYQNIDGLLGPLQIAHEPLGGNNAQVRGADLVCRDVAPPDTCRLANLHHLSLAKYRGVVGYCAERAGDRTGNTRNPHAGNYAASHWLNLVQARREPRRSQFDHSTIPPSPRWSGTRLSAGALKIGRAH